MKDPIVPIATYTFTRAQMAKSRLEAEGIDCFLQNINVIQPNIAGGIKLMVKAADVEKAFRILSKIEQNYIHTQEEQDTHAEKIITIGSYNYIKSQILKARLEVEGIECYLQNINLIQPNIAEGVKVRIKEEDIKRALPIIIKLNKEYEKENSNEDKLLPPPQFNKLLVPIDFTEYSESAAKYALRIAMRFGSEINFFHAYFNPSVYTEPFTEGYAFHLNVYKYQRDIETQAQKSLSLFAQKFEDYCKRYNADNVTIRQTLACGFADSEVINYARVYKPDLLILGVKGENEMPGITMGNITQHIIKRTTGNLLVIPKQSKFNTLEKIKNVVYITKLDRTDFISIRKLLSLISILKAKVHVVHLCQNNDDPWTKPLLEQLNKSISKKYHNLDIEFHLFTCNEKYLKLKELIDKKNIGLAAFTQHKSGLLSKIFNPEEDTEMMLLNDLPMLIFKM